MRANEAGPDPNLSQKRELSRLINGALRTKGWTLKDLDLHARQNRIRGFTMRNMAHYVGVNPSYSRWPPNIDISLLATILGHRPQDWEEALGLRSRDSHPFYTREEILENQKSLDEGDEIWVVSCRGFLEDEDKEIADVVRENLRRGVAYKYFFPAGDSGPHPFGNRAAESYTSFRESIMNTWSYPSPPRMVGFGVDVTKFPFFSKLHTLIYSRRRDTGRNLPLVFIEYDSRVAGDGAGSVWYRLKHDDFNIVAEALIRTCDPIADLGLRLNPLNGGLQTVARTYVRFFRNSAWTELYHDVREILNNTDLCVNALSEEIARTRLPEHVQCLDIGCGDGVVTAGVVRALLEAGHDLTVTLLDPSPAQLEGAQRTMNVLAADFPGRLHVISIDTTLQDAPLRQYDLALAVHSLYVVDEVYLRKIYEHLNTPGLACIWLGSLENNVLNQICAAVDQQRGRQRRNFAEDVYGALELYGLKNRSGLRQRNYETVIQHLCDSEGHLNAAGRIITEFFALSAEETVLATAAAAARANWTPEGHRVNDVLITFRRSG